MARRKDKEKVIQMRRRGLSYSQIKEKTGISKSTLSNWLSDMPLSEERIKELRDWNPRRIERCRVTKLKKRQEKLGKIYLQEKDNIGNISERDLLIGGLFLYWGEGTKRARDVVAFTNTDPNMIVFFIKWLSLYNIDKKSLRIKLHLYKDMSIEGEIKFWSRKLGVPKENFRKPYVKDSKFSSLTYKNSFGHGTCEVSFGSALLHNKIIMSLKYLRDIV